MLENMSWPPSKFMLVYQKSQPKISVLPDKNFIRFHLPFHFGPVRNDLWWKYLVELAMATHGWLVFIILGKSWFLHIINAVNEPILMVLIAQDMSLYHFIGHRDTRFIMSMNLRDNDYLNWSLASRTLNISGSCVIPAERYIVFNSIKSSTAESWLYLTTDPKRGQLGIIGNAPSSDRNGFALCCFGPPTRITVKWNF